MGPFDKAKDPRNPRAHRKPGDDVPLLPVRHKSQKQNIWTDDTEQGTELGSLRRRSSETFYRFLEGEEEEDTGGVSAENGRYSDSEDNGLAKTSIDDPQSVCPGRRRSNSESLLRFGPSESLLLNKPPTSDLDPDESKLFEDDSPYEEVRAAVSNTDDSMMACVIQFQS